MDTGEYCHIGLTKAVQQIVSGRIALGHTFDTINLLTNIDGAPITRKSSQKGIWTIWCKDKDYKGVYIVGLYYGAAKPKNANDFLKNFTDEAIPLINNKYVHGGKEFNIKIHGFICYAPAKAFILNTKYPSGYFSCSKCIIKGKHYNSVCFPVSSHKSLHDYCNVHLRIDHNLKNFKYQQRKGKDSYQKGLTVLSNLPNTELVSNVPLDAMHLQGDDQGCGSWIWLKLQEVLLYDK